MFNPHDIVLLRHGAKVLGISTAPVWVRDIVTHTHHYVVRRAPMVDNKVPIGIRGRYRGARYASFVRRTDIIDCITPSTLVRQRTWRAPFVQGFGLPWNAISATLDRLIILLQPYLWGIGGSVGYSLVTQVAATTAHSDLDIIMQQDQPLAFTDVAQLLACIRQLPMVVDIQVQNKQGAFHLCEYGQYPEEPILLKTEQGPVLTKNLWVGC